MDRRLDDNEFNANAKILLDMGDQEANPESYEIVLKRCTKLGLTVIPFKVDPESQDHYQRIRREGTKFVLFGDVGVYLQHG